MLETVGRSHNTASSASHPAALSSFCSCCCTARPWSPAPTTPQRSVLFEKQLGWGFGDFFSCLSLPSPGAYPALSTTSSAPFDTPHFLPGPLSIALAPQHTPFFTSFTLYAFTLYFLGSSLYFQALTFQSKTCAAIKQPCCHPARLRCGALRPSQPGGSADGSCERYTSASPAGKPRLCRML